MPPFYNSPHSSSNQLHLGNGQGMPITTVGYSSLETNQRPLHLRNILHVPKILKNLLSVYKLTFKNDVIFEFHLYFCLIKDQATWEFLLCGTVKDSLYRLNSSQHTPCAMVGERTSSQVWYQRLEHPHLRILQNIIIKFRFLIFHQIQSSLCDSWCMSKSHKQPFNCISCATSRPLELVHSNLWGIVSHFGFHYYVIIINDYSKYL